jgi:hypothetical protein
MWTTEQLQGRAAEMKRRVKAERKAERKAGRKLGRVEKWLAALEAGREAARAEREATREAARDYLLLQWRRDDMAVEESLRKAQRKAQRKVQRAANTKEGKRKVRAARLRNLDAQPRPRDSWEAAKLRAPVLPLTATQVREKRDKEIRRRYALGHGSRRELAEAYRLSISSIQQIIKKRGRWQNKAEQPIDHG